MISGQNHSSPRQEFALGGGKDQGARGLVQGRFKLVLGKAAGTGMSGYTGTCTSIESPKAPLLLGIEPAGLTLGEPVGFILIVVLRYQLSEYHYPTSWETL